MASQVEEVERLLSAMTRAERAAILQVVVRGLGDAFPGIECASDICRFPAAREKTGTRCVGITSDWASLLTNCCLRFSVALVVELP